MLLIEDASQEKLRGAYYTPPRVADFILRWGLSGFSYPVDILEPSCGDGVFIDCLYRGQYSFKSLTGVEVEPDEAAKARDIKLKNSRILTEDFHSFCLNADSQYDLIVGNPPFIRYQYYKEEQQKLANKIFSSIALRRSKLTNAWVTFVVGCTTLLRENARMAFVLPSELLMVKYASQLRKLLASVFNKITIVSFQNLVFEEIQQEVVLLLCEKNGTSKHQIEHIEVKDEDELLSLSPAKLSCPTKEIDFCSDKWTYYFLEKRELDFLKKLKSKMPIIANYADVEVGITTGSNKYFTVPQKIVKLFELEEFAKPMVGRSVQVNSLCLTPEDWLANVEAGANANLLVFKPGIRETGNPGVRAYILNGESEGVNKGYKTSIRDDWYVIPSIKLSDALFLRRNNLYPKFVLNEAHAYTTDTMHRVYIHSGINKRAFVASYYNSVSFVFAELLGRNFGGGCLELMPSEVEGIYLPYRECNETLFDTIDTMLRQKVETSEILNYTDPIILGKGMGLSDEEIALARKLWQKLMDRRHNRAASSKA